MNVKMGFDNLNKALATLKLVFDNEAIAEDQKNIIFWNSDSGFKVVARNAIVDCICGVEAECEATENEMVNIKYKELDNVLTAFKSLSMTKTTDIEFKFNDKSIDVCVYEEPIDDEYDFADRLYRKNKFTLSLVKSVADSIKKEILSVSLDTEGVAISGEDVLKYFNALIPTIKDIKTEGVGSRYSVVNGYAYTTPMQFVAIMKNDVPDFSEFILTKATAEFIKSFFSNENTTNVYIVETDKGSKLIRLTNSTACAIIKAYGTDKAFVIDDYKSIPKNGVAVDKKYFCDVLRRMKADEAVKITITEEEITLSQARVNVTVPVLTSILPEEDSKVSFSSTVPLINNLVFSHFMAGDRLFIYFEEGKNNKWDLTFTDDSQAIDGSHLWWTRISHRKN